MNTLLTLLTGGGLVAGSMLLSAWQTSRNASKRDEAAHVHELQMAQEARRQDRLERVYNELGIYLGHWTEWARSVHPFMGPRPRPRRVSSEEEWRIQTAVINHGSLEVHQLLTQWFERRRKIEHADIVISTAETHPDSGELNEQARQERLALEDHRKALYEADAAIREQMHKELNGKAAQGES